MGLPNASIFCQRALEVLSYGFMGNIRVILSKTLILCHFFENSYQGPRFVLIFWVSYWHGGRQSLLFHCKILTDLGRPSQNLGLSGDRTTENLGPWFILWFNSVTPIIVFQPKTVTLLSMAINIFYYSVFLLNWSIDVYFYPNFSLSF